MVNQFVVSVLVHSTGEATLDTEKQEDHIFIYPVKIFPAITINSKQQLTEEELARIRLMILHQLARAFLVLATPTGVEVKEHYDINMNPNHEEQN